MKFNWLSNGAWASTGYGTQTRQILTALKAAGHDPAVTAFYGVEGAVLNWGGIPHYPKGFHAYGSDVASANTLHHGARLVISFLDIWVVVPEMIDSRVKWAAYFPIDHDPIPPPVRDKAAQAWRRIVYSKFGAAKCDQAGLDYDYIPHCVDTETFKPIPAREARARLGWPQDAFIVGMVAANKGNPSRKNFQQQLEAFKLLHTAHPDTLMYIHCHAGTENEGVNLRELVDALGLTDAVFFANSYDYYRGLPDEYLVNAYNAMDALTNVAMGEGFGIPILEAQSCGTPVIVGDWTSMSELCFGGWKVDRADAAPFWTPLAAYQFVPRAEAIAEQMLNAYDGAGNFTLQKKARRGAVEYDTQKVVREGWLPLLARYEAALVEEYGSAEFTREMAGAA